MVGKTLLSRAFLASVLLSALAIGAEEPPWTSTLSYRLLVEVPPVALEGRDRDEIPAEVAIDFAAALESLDTEGIPALNTLHITPIGADGVGAASHIEGAESLPFRWYDNAIPYAFSEVFAPVSYTDGERRRMTTPRAGYMYNALGDWKSGRLAWTHTQSGAETGHYAIYFDILAPGESPAATPPRAWLGDGMPRHAEAGESTTGADHTHISIDDWDGDGRNDIVYGEQYGQISVLFNRGTPSEPQYPYAKLLFDEEGLPLDTGVHAAVLVVDWDGDGAKDLLVGTYMNRISFFRNTGTNARRTFAYQGLLRDADGGFLSLPVTPVARKAEGLFKEDYYPVLNFVDWNGDGRRDLIAGGYITGRIYYFENIGVDIDNLPQLKLRGPVEADGVPINVRDWCASPSVADLNGDGLRDMVSGAYTWGGSAGERPAFIRYYENQGSSDRPEFSEKLLPIQGDAVRLRVPHPVIEDWNHDGLPDLIVASGANIFLWENVGTRTAPVFAVNTEAIPSAWGNAPLPGGHQVLDWNGDGYVDLVQGYTVWLNSGAGNPYAFDETIPVLPDGVRIDHPTDMGDGHFWPYLHDLDQDGQIDVLFGDWHGHVWFHQNTSADGNLSYDVEGYRLATEDGAPIKVGPVAGDTEKNFQVHQGARTKFTVGDFNDDGLDDLVVGDTHGIVRYYQNLGTTGNPVFATSLEVGNLKTRLNVDKIDWNGDGRLDVISGVANHRIVVFLNTGSDGAAAFDEGTQLDVPAIKGPEVMVADINQDGDDDLIINGTQGTTLLERSFLRHGYAPATILGVETKQE